MKNTTTSQITINWKPIDANTNVLTIKGEALHYAREYNKPQYIVVRANADEGRQEYSIVDDNYLETNPESTVFFSTKAFGDELNARDKIKIQDFHQEKEMSKDFYQQPLANPKSMNGYVYTNNKGTVKRIDKVSVNSKCDCGSGKKYKHCHGNV
jgi:hypothetical protein